ncbi:DUF6716 putative glycosyltransferase [Demequina salsinemoris]|uniref:DUF6716 putative glycosyltransferase n=1 Tax=Demequina salsinemoris TaxID=577470 RepID=UPI000784519C|nr:DUF6716 putative glycosyltransferase [Demequina salsinemoris]
MTDRASTGDRPIRVVGVADSDSYLKWLAYTLDRLPEDWDVSIHSLIGSATPSPAQTVALLDGSSFDPERCTLVAIKELAALLESEDADVLLLATRGPAAWLVMENVVAGMTHRPVVVTGLPGISIPAQRLGTVYRSGADLFVLHSAREVEAYEELVGDDPLRGTFALATLPFAGLGDRSASPNEVLFAAQALVPYEQEERESILRALADLARARADLDVIVKVRAVAGEAQTHAETFAFPDLLEGLRRGGLDVPPNLKVSGASMREHLERAVGVVTVSSTAAIEAIAAEVPVLILGDFGVSDRMINTVFVGSDTIGTLDDLRAGVFRMPAEEWLARNYFHPASEDDVVPRLRELVARRRSEGLPEPRSIVRDELGWRKRLRARAAAGDLEPGSPQAVLLAVTTRVLRGIRWRLNRLRRAGD